MSENPSRLSDADYRRLLEFRDGLRKFLRWSEERARQASLTPAQHQLLLAVRGHGSPPSVGDVAEHLMLRHHSVVELIDRAARAQLVERFADEDDQRVVRVRLTAEGERRLSELSTAHLEELARIGNRWAAVWSGLPPASPTTAAEVGEGPV